MNNLSKYRCFTFKVGDNEIEVKMYFGAKEPSSMLDSNVEYEYTYFINGQVSDSGFSEEEPRELIETIRGEIESLDSSVNSNCLNKNINDWNEIGINNCLDLDIRFDNEPFIYSVPGERDFKKIILSDPAERVPAHTYRRNLINLTPEQRSAHYKAMYEERKAKEVALLQKRKDALDNDKRLEQDADSWLENLVGNDRNVLDQLSTHDDNSREIKHKKEVLNNDEELEKEVDLWLSLAKENKGYSHEKKIINGEKYD